MCREVYTNHHRTSSSFFNFFAFFCKKILKTLKNQCFQKSLFWHFFENRPLLLHFTVQKHPFPARFCTFRAKTTTFLYSCMYNAYLYTYGKYDTIYRLAFEFKYIYRTIERLSTFTRLKFCLEPKIRHGTMKTASDK